MMQPGFRWRDVILWDDLDAALQDLLALEEQSKGEPRWYPYHNACNELFKVMDDLKVQLEASSRNAYYRVRKGEEKR